MTTIQNSCIVSLATKNSSYVDGLARLSNSLRDNAAGVDFLGFIHEQSVNAPLHAESPYGFKIHAIQYAIDAGYTSVLWLDCSVWAVAPVKCIFDIIDRQGYFFEGNGCMLGSWTNDRVLEHWEITRDEAMEAPMMQAGFMGFNLKNKTGRRIWEELKDAYSKDLFQGRWTNADLTESADPRCLGSRHEQSCLSCILHKRKIPFSPVAEYVQYAGIYDKVINDKIIFKCQGL